MAEKKKSAGGSPGFVRLKEALSAGKLGTVYIFHGEESYLREYYLTEMKKNLVAGLEKLPFPQAGEQGPERSVLDGRRGGDANDGAADHGGGSGLGSLQAERRAAGGPSHPSGGFSAVLLPGVRLRPDRV